YAGAPYIDFLRARNKDQSRVFAREWVLYPNWAGAFGLADVRDLDGLYYRRYIDFIRSFLLKPGDEHRLSGDLADRFTGAEAGYSYAFDTDTEKRFLALSSVKYLIGTSKVLDETPFREVYHKEVYIYEVPNVLPRASLFHAAEVLPEANV